MAKYHINPQGNPGLCRAASGRCPFGSADAHYDSSEEARTAFEVSMTGSAVGEPLTSKEVKVAVLERQSTGFTTDQLATITPDSDDTVQELEEKNARALRYVKGADTVGATQAIDASLAVTAELNRRRGSGPVAYDGGRRLTTGAAPYTPRPSYEAYRPLTKRSAPTSDAVFSNLRSKRVA